MEQEELGYSIPHLSLFILNLATLLNHDNTKGRDTNFTSCIDLLLLIMSILGPSGLIVHSSNELEGLSAASQRTRIRRAVENVADSRLWFSCRRWYQ